jgi:uncharacterized protein YegJ (DUF2314 family)
MPIYHLHLINAHIDADDVEGHDLPDLDVARAKALAGIRDFLAHELAKGTLDFRGRVDIEDDNGAVLESISFADAVAVKGL